ncbi:META domain-containing protein [Aquimarina sp. AU474]|uniref:META domain-containing protein n=1 Tax=Aquimarina sp. AU474 TaxID=2108529 RepID=UPI000D697011|nr:META domain-containing protein [Aquimarina sp. AU474]
MKYLTLILFSFILSNTNTCNTKNKTTASTTAEIQTNKKDKFEIHQLNGKNVQAEKLFIVFDKENSRISGYSGCNTFSCKYTQDKDVISFGIPMASKMYCQAKTDLEQEFFKTLSLVSIKIIENDLLVLKNTNGKELFSGKRLEN